MDGKGEKQRPTRSARTGPRRRGDGHRGAGPANGRVLRGTVLGLAGCFYVKAQAIDIAS